MKIHQRVGLTLVVTAVLCGCASMTERPPQQIAISVMPEVAKCDAYQHGNLVGSYDTSRKTITVPASPGSLDIVCSAPGFKDKRVNVVPDYRDSGTFGALAVDFGPIDAAKYPGSIQIVMEPENRAGQPS